MPPLESDVPVTAAVRQLDRLLERGLVDQARKVARLSEKRRRLRKQLRDLEAELRRERNFLRGLASDRATR